MPETVASNADILWGTMRFMGTGYQVIDCNPLNGIGKVLGIKHLL